MVKDALIHTKRTDQDVVNALADMEGDFAQLFQSWIDNAQSPAAAKFGLLLTERWVACDLLRFMLTANALIDHLPDELVEGVGDEIDYLRTTAMATGDWAWAERELQEIVAAIFDDEDDDA